MQELQDLHPDAVVSLREIGAETVATVCRLSDTLTEPKKNFVATNERSLEQAQANEKAWIAQYMPMTTPVGFVTLPLTIAGYLWTTSPPERYVSSVRCVLFRGSQVLVFHDKTGTANLLPGGRCEPGTSVRGPGL